MRDFREPLDYTEYFCPDVFKRGGRDEREADEEDVGLGVRERAQAVIVLLAGRVPQPEVERLAVDRHVGRVVVKAGLAGGTRWECTRRETRWWCS